MLVKTPRMTAATMTTIVESRSSVRVGIEVFRSSSNISVKNVRALLNGLRIGESGRGGGNRTPNQRFWRPLLYQLSYTPVVCFLRRESRGPVSRPRRSSKTVIGRLFDDVGDMTGTDRATTLTDGELLGL